MVPYLIVTHRPVGSYHGSADWLCRASTEASAHVLTEGNGTGVDQATQLVPWHMKAWHCVSFNSVSYGIEVDDNAWDGTDPGAFERAARIHAFLCHKTGIPAVWTRDPTHKPGIVRHFDLGLAGGGHLDPTDGPHGLQHRPLWERFIKQVEHELARGHFRRSWGRGTLAHL
jgi:hypothetical protein